MKILNSLHLKYENTGPLLTNSFRAKFSSKEAKEGKAKKDMFSINVHKIGQGILGYVCQNKSYLCLKSQKYVDQCLSRITLHSYEVKKGHCWKTLNFLSP